MGDIEQVPQEVPVLANPNPSKFSQSVANEVSSFHFLYVYRTFFNLFSETLLGDPRDLDRAADILGLTLR